MKENPPVPCYYIHMPLTRRGVSRDLLVSAESVTLDSITSGEAYAYRTCMAVPSTYSNGFHSPHDFGPMIYIGAMLSHDDFMDGTEGWRSAFPRKHSHGGDDYKAKLMDVLFKPYNGRIPCSLAVDRYGDVYPMYEGDSIEPVDWNEVQPMRVEITHKPGYDYSDDPANAWTEKVIK